MVDRSLGMGEAAGSIPAQSTRFLSEPKDGSGLFFKKVNYTSQVSSHIEIFRFLNRFVLHPYKDGDFS